MGSIFSQWRSLARGTVKKTRRPPCRRLALGVEILECRLTPTVDLFLPPRAVVALNPQPLPPTSYVQVDPQAVVTQLITSGPPQSSDTPVHLQGQFVEVLADPGPIVARRLSTRGGGLASRHEPEDLPPTALMRLVGGAVAPFELLDAQRGREGGVCSYVQCMSALKETV